MSRNRLTNRVASDMKSKPGTQVEAKGSGVDNDVYNMNDTGHEKNDPSVSEYAKGDPEAWNEGVNKDKVNKDDQKREETGHAPLVDKHAATEAIASARRLEEKAVKAIIASQRMLPGATDEIIEKQAGILMHLPEEGLNATLSNQESLAKLIAKAASDSSEESEEEKEEETPDEEEKEEEKSAAEETPDEEKKEEEKAATVEMTPKEKLASLKKQAEELEKQINAAEEKKEDDACDKEAGEKGDEETSKEDEETSKEASLLDQIFSGVMPSPIKKGASKLSGMVKKEASSGANNDLASLWASAPDVKDVFN